MGAPKQEKLMFLFCWQKPPSPPGVASLGATLQNSMEGQQKNCIEAKALCEQDLQSHREVVEALLGKWALASVAAGPQEELMPPCTELEIKKFLKEKYQPTRMKQIGEDLLSYLLQPKVDGDVVGPTALSFGDGCPPHSTLNVLHT